MKETNELENRIKILEYNFIKLYKESHPPKFKLGDTVKYENYNWKITTYPSPDTLDGIVFNLNYAHWRNPYRYYISLEGLEQVSQIVNEDEIELL